MAKKKTRKQSSVGFDLDDQQVEAPGQELVATNARIAQLEQELAVARAQIETLREENGLAEARARIQIRKEMDVTLQVEKVALKGQTDALTAEINRLAAAEAIRLKKEADDAAEAKEEEKKAPKEVKEEAPQIEKSMHKSSSCCGVLGQIVKYGAAVASGIAGEHFLGLWGKSQPILNQVWNYNYASLVSSVANHLEQFGCANTTSAAMNATCAWYNDPEKSNEHAAAFIVGIATLVMSISYCCRAKANRAQEQDAGVAVA